jgi:hypothetical protein
VCGEVHDLGIYPQKKHFPVYSFTGDQVDLGCGGEKEVCLFSCSQSFHGLNENASLHIY